MHKKRSRQSKISYYANILIVSAITLIVYGIVLNFTSGTNIFAPIINPENNNESTINITTNDGSQVVPGNTIKGSNKGGSLGGNASSIIPDEPSNDNQSPNSGGSTGSNNNNDQSDSSQQQIQQPQPPSIEEINNTFRNTIQSTYNISVKYGSETSGYIVGDIATTPILDSTVINSALNNLNNTLAKYPKGFFSEIRNGGIPLTVILINNYSNTSITGVTDSNYSFANISIAVSHPFEESFFHESYHYIERYIFKKGGNFSAWDSLNPSGFIYDETISNMYSYANTFSETAPFVNTYAQTAATEDRASTFEYMMASNKASCLNQNTIVWRKASMISGMIDAVFTTVNPSTLEYWERHL